MEFTKEQELAQKIILEAWNNPSFKSTLLKSPIKAIYDLTGETIRLPEGVDRMEVVDQSDSTCTYFNIPAKPNMEDVELTEEQLEIVTGGNGSDNPPPPPPPPIPGYTI